MVVPVSSLSVAIQGIADFLDGEFGEDVVITVDTPQRASERVKGNDKHFLNIFVYRVAPSGFHASTASDEPYFVRINTLLTPFLGDQDAQPDADLCILGHAIRVLQSRPVIPAILPGAPGPAPDFRTDPHLDFRLQAVLQAPTMEELNHIWTTQGGELAYRLSAAYEFALIPIEPLEHHEPAGPMTTAIFDVQANLDGRDAPGFIAYSDATTAIPVGGIGPGDPPPEPPTSWLPILLLVDGQTLSNSRTVAAGTAGVQIALAGPPGERVGLEVAWTREDGSEETQPPQIFTVQSHRIDDPQALEDVDLQNAAEGDTAIILTRPVDAADQLLATSPYANTLTLSVGGP